MPTFVAENDEDGQSGSRQRGSSVVPSGRQHLVRVKADRHMSKRAHIRIAIGVRAHSGWAAVVAVAGDARGLRVLDRQRVVVIDAEGPRANQPYHFAEMLPLDQAQTHLDRHEKTAIRLATTALENMVEKLRESGQDVIGCAILQASGRTLPALPQILASHALIHTAEGQFFRNVFAHACERINVTVAKIRERELDALAARELRLTPPKVKSKLADLGRELGPPWTQDQKFAALGAWLLLAQRSATQFQKMTTERTQEN
jgi:hypothetical protein